MLFVEPFFLFVLLPTALFAFYLAGSYTNRTAALFVIVVASAIFYAPYGVLPSTLLASSLCINLIIGISLSQASNAMLRKVLLWVGLSLNFAALGTFKYFDQFVELAFPLRGPILQVAIPAGISFYTFHQAVFLLHAYNRHSEVADFLKDAQTTLGKSVAFIRYAAFVAFFPQLVIGPITYLQEFAPQIQSSRFGRPRSVDLQVGVTLIVIGLFKKLYIADTLARIVNPIYASLSTDLLISSTDAAFGIVGYFFQLYFDFSGYSDIALGIARLFGLRLPMNFDSPLRATGIMDFYRRWHMTLTRVIGVFVFTPLSIKGTRYAVDRKLMGWRRRAFGSWIPLLLNFQIIALWHSAKFTFIVFGIIHGIWFVIETEVRMSAAFKAYRTRFSEGFRTLAGMAITVVPLMLTFALFRSDSLQAFGKLLSRLVAFQTLGSTVLIPTKWYWVMLAGVAVLVYFFPNAYEVLRRYRPCIVTFANQSITLSLLRVRWRPSLPWALFIVVLGCAVFTKISQPTVFLYEGF